jgi:four helix bundle protein
MSAVGRRFAKLDGDEAKVMAGGIALADTGPYDERRKHESEYGRRAMTDATRGYRDLIVWQKAMQLVPAVYALVKKLPTEERYALSDQIRRAVVSVPANIAEGQARQHAAEFAQHLAIARGSLAELDTLLLVAAQLGYVTEAELQRIAPLLTDVRRLLQALIHSVHARARAS